jgi:hypothetical protein
MELTHHESNLIRSAENAEASLTRIMCLCEDLDGTDPAAIDVRQDIIGDLYKAVQHLDACVALLEEARTACWKADPLWESREDFLP